MSDLLHDLRGCLGVVLNDLYIMSASSKDAERALNNLEKGLALIENIASEDKQHLINSNEKIKLDCELNVFLIDDNQHFSQSVGRVIEGLSDRISFKSEINIDNLAADELVKWADIIFLDLNLTAKVDGVEVGFALLETLQEEIRRQSSRCGVWILSGSNSYENGLRALKAGALGFASKPISPNRLGEILVTFSQNRGQNVDFLDTFIVGNTPKIQKLKREIPYVAFARKLPVLILGETGTGKSLLAKIIHDVSKRGEFVKFNPTTSPEIMVSELLGYEKGAFTGADARRLGLIKKADGGTLFIDEFDALPLGVQTSLLGVLQDGYFRPLGGREDVRSDFRLIVATNKDPELLIDKGLLREDFYHRISGIKLELPPLRERKEDIVAIATEAKNIFFIENPDLQPIEFSDKFIAYLKSAPWRGNVRELHSFVVDSLYRSTFLNHNEVGVDEHHESKNYIAGDPTTANLSELVEQFKVERVNLALQKFDGNRRVAANHLGIDLSTLGRILKRGS